MSLLRYDSFSARWWAFVQMGWGPGRFRSVPGLRHVRMLGSGAGNGFSIWPNFGVYGWLGVWEDRALEVQVVDRFNVDFSTAHNAVIEMLLAAGVFGAILLLVTMGALIWPTMRLAVQRGPDHRIGVVAVGLVGYVVAVNQLETYVGANLLPWALLVAVAAACVRRLDEVDPTDRPEVATGPGAAT